MTVDQAGLRAVAELHHRYLTGVILALVHRQGTHRTAEVVRRTFRRQHLEKFLPGLEKLGLRELPDAVACAQYHYLSNALGGVKVEWIAESDTKWSVTTCRRAGSGTASPCAPCRPRSTGRCSGAGTPTTASRSATTVSGSSPRR